MAKAHPGFRAAAASIEQREGVSKESADKILAAGARKASPAAKKANPRLNRVSNPHGNPGHHPSTSAYEHEGSTHTSKMR